MALVAIAAALVAATSASARVVAFGWAGSTSSGPAVAIVSHPADPTNDTTATFAFTANDGNASFTCSLDGSDPTGCVSPQTYSGLGNGPHTFSVQAIDLAGNTGGADTYSWTIDTTAPSVTITSRPPNPSNSTSATFAFVSNDPSASFACSVDGSPSAPCGSPRTYTGLSQGTHTFQVQATDQAGNTSNPDTYTWTIDTTPPTAAIVSHPADPTSNTTATFAFSSDDGNATFTCSLDGSPSAPCGSPRTYTGLSQGTHTFQVQATDQAGNTSNPDTYTWTIDTTPPTAAIVSHPADPTSNTTATLGFTSNDGNASFTCSLDAGAYQACTSPAKYTGLGEGSHTFVVRAADQAGNTGSDSYSWTIDTTAPTVSIVSKPANPSNSTAASFAFTTNDDAASLTCSLDGGSFQPCSSPLTYSGLGQGAHVFVVHGTDQAGNTGSDSYTWTIDTVPPSVSIFSRPPNPATNNSATFGFGSNDRSAGFTCSLDGGAFQPCSSPRTYMSLGDGPHTFVVHATDEAGNTGGDSYSWTIDTTAPTVSIVSKPANPATSTDASFAFTSGDDTASFTCALDSDSYLPCTSPSTYSGLSDGPHTFQVRATDAAGNTGSDSYSWTIDATPPTVTIDSRPADPTNSASASFSFFSDDDTASFACALDSGAYASCTSPATYTGVADGSHTFHVRATDAAGNSGSDSYSWTVDTTPPTVAIDSHPANPTTNTSATFAFSSDGAASFTCALDSGAYEQCTSPATYTGLGPGSHTFHVQATDAAGNTSEPQSYSWTVRPAMCTAPNVRGMTLANAKAAIVAAGCRVGYIGRVYSTTVKRGLVISQTPRPGTKGAKNDPVSVTVSLGPRP